MAGVKRTITASGTWLTRKASDMAESLAQRSGSSLTSQQIIDGYVVIAKKIQLSRGNPGVPAHMQTAQVKNSVRLSALVIDLPAFLCLPGRLIRGDGSQDPDKAYIQTLSAGRDSYLPGLVTAVLPPQTEPLTLAGPYTDIAIGSRSLTGNRVPTRFWGVAQPFQGVGCMYGYGAVYLSNASQRWSLTWGKLTDSFVYRMTVLTPSVLRYMTADGVTTTVPEQPTALATAWTLEISESVLAALGAVAFTRFEGDNPTEGAEANWELAQYPWFTFSKPKQFVNDTGDTGYKVVVCAQVVYDYGGPYAQTLPDNTNGWGEVDTASPAGGRGLWVAEIQVLKGVASVLHQYKLYGGEDNRRPLLIDHRGSGAIFPNRWYADNVTYKTSPVTLESGQAIMVSVTYIDRTQRIVDQPIQPFEGYMFLDVSWFQDGLQRTQNITTTALTRSVFVPSDTGELTGNYIAHLTALDAGQSEGRFAIGGATDGTIVVMPVFSAFIPGESPRLQVLVANTISVTTGYDGKPGFAMMMGLGIDECVDIQHVEHPISGSPDPADDKPLRFWSIPAGCDQVAYIGNHNFVFFISTEWTTPADSDSGFTPRGNIGLAIYNATDGSVAVAGVIDATLGSTGLTPTGNLGAALSTLTQVYFSRRLGRIEVVREESEGYLPAEAGQSQVGHPATLIVTAGRGNAGLALDSEDGADIKDGATVISYDSGKTWVTFLQYGSPAGAFHCGNIAQARSEPVVRV